MEPLAADPALLQKPLLRGVSHAFAFFVALAAAVPLALRAHSRAAFLASVIFGASLVLLFGTSALYHRVQWGAVGRQRMRRLDHAAIFVLIAGGYAPLFTLVPSASSGHGALWTVGIGAGLGVLKSVFWVRAPKWISALLYVALGWTVVGEVLARAPAVGWLAIGMLVASGTIYSIGAVVYALKRPDPVPAVFGYHEVFHALVVVASVCLFAHVVLVMRAVG
jgi:hemolysin III